MAATALPGRLDIANLQSLKQVLVRFPHSARRVGDEPKGWPKLLFERPHFYVANAKSSSIDP